MAIEVDLEATIDQVLEGHGCTFLKDITGSSVAPACTAVLTGYGYSYADDNCDLECKTISYNFTAELTVSDADIVRDVFLIAIGDPGAAATEDAFVEGFDTALYAGIEALGDPHPTIPVNTSHVNGHFSAFNVKKVDVVSASVNGVLLQPPTAAPVTGAPTPAGATGTPTAPQSSAADVRLATTVILTAVVCFTHLF